MGNIWWLKSNGSLRPQRATCALQTGTDPLHGWPPHPFFPCIPWPLPLASLMTDLGSKLGNEPWRVVITQVPYISVWSCPIHSVCVWGGGGRREAYLALICYFLTIDIWSRTGPGQPRSCCRKLVCGSVWTSEKGEPLQSRQGDFILPSPTDRMTEG